MHWTDEHYNQAIDHIKSVTKVTGEDNHVIGNKYTECSIGLCSEDFENKSKYPPYRKPHHLCPLDMRQSLKESSGCFYYCAFFKPSKNKTGLTPLQLVKQFKIPGETNE